MSKQVQLQIDGERGILRTGGRTNDGQLTVFRRVTPGEKTLSQVLNTVVVDRSAYGDLRGKSLILYNEETGRFLDVAPVSGDLPPERIRLTNYVRDALEAGDGSPLVLLESKTNVFTRVTVQKIDKIKEDLVVLSDRDEDGNRWDPDRFSLFRIFNPYTGDSIVLKKSHVQVSSTLPAGSIALNRKQRTFLGVELPKSISPSYWEAIFAHLPEDDPGRETVLSAFQTEGHLLREDLSYEEKQRVKAVLDRCCPVRVCVVPEIGSYCRRARKKIGKAVADFYVGKATASLLCRRPYESDEGADAVRMTGSTMSLLGVGEMDKVVLQYRDRSVSCRVLKLDDEKAFFEANLPTTLNYAVGVPAHVRKKLGVYGVNTAIKVDRDTGFLFRKSINEQIVPVLLTLFSVNLFQDPSVWKKALISLLAIPVVVYFNLSSKRNMRG